MVLGQRQGTPGNNEAKASGEFNLVHDAAIDRGGFTWPKTDAGARGRAGAWA